MGTAWLTAFWNLIMDPTWGHMLLKSSKVVASQKKRQEQRHEARQHKQNNLLWTELCSWRRETYILLPYLTSRYVCVSLGGDQKHLSDSWISPLVFCFPITTTTTRPVVLLYYLNAHDMWEIESYKHSQKELWKNIIIIIIIIIVYYYY